MNSTRTVYRNICYLLSGRVRALAGFPVVTRPVERYRFTALALVVVHLVAFFDFDLMNFYRATAFAAHYDFGAHHLTCARLVSGEYVYIFVFSNRSLRTSVGFLFFFFPIIIIVPKNANIAVRFFDDDRPSDPFMNNVLSFLGLGLSWPDIMYTPSEYAGGVFRVM